MTNFNPRSHERSDVNVPPSTLSPLISIHAPTRGATKRCWIECWCYSNFNPRSHERSDSTATAYLDSPSISIHAPTRGATVNALEYCQPYRISIHAPTRGATPKSSYNLSFQSFQSTLPREERHSCFISNRTFTVDFNPRSHERSDNLCANSVNFQVISIHAPTRGATMTRKAHCTRRS